jgi:hypothetical protein
MLRVVNTLYINLKKKNDFPKLSQATTLCVQETLTKEQILDLYCYGIDK